MSGDASTTTRRHLNLLSLDGGGVKGLSSLLLLEQLMANIDPDAEESPKPCDYFDMIGGTSTGGLIALMLGRLRMSVGDCIDAYLRLSDEVFQRKHYLPIKLASGQTQARFDSKALEAAIRRIVFNNSTPKDENLLLYDSNLSHCHVFVCATSEQMALETVNLTSYRNPRYLPDLLKVTKIWEAARATSAATTFFDPIQIGMYEERFVDGASGANNPIREVWTEASDMWKELGPLHSNIHCLISIGTGEPAADPFGTSMTEVGKALKNISLETEKTARKFHDEHYQLRSEGHYFRFNVTKGLEHVGLEHSHRRAEIAAATRKYIRETHEDLGKCSLMLRRRGCSCRGIHRPKFGTTNVIPLDTVSYNLRSPFETALVSSSAHEGRNADPTRVREEIRRLLWFDGMSRKARKSRPDISFNCSWVWETEISSWLKGPNTVFWLCGKPGSGKSTIMSYMAKDRQTQEHLDALGPRWNILIFFFDYDAGKDIANTIDGMLRAFIFQLLNYIWDFPPEFRTTILMWCDGSLTHLDAIDFVCQMIQGTQNHFCVFVDGLDEYKGNRVHLLQTLDVLKARTKTKIFLSSRDLPEIRSQLDTHPSIRMQDYNVASMQAYVKAEIEKVVQYDIDFARRFTSSLQMLLVKKAQGVILWFKLAVDKVMQAVLRKESFVEIRNIVNDLPPDLGTMYQRILETIDPVAKVEGAMLLFAFNFIQDLGYNKPNAALLQQLYNFLIHRSTETLHIATLDSVDHLLRRARQILHGLLEVYLVSDDIGDDSDDADDDGDDEILLDIFFKDQTPRSRTSVRLVHETFHAYLASTSWVANNLHAFVRDRYFMDAGLFLLVDIIAEAAVNENFNESMIRGCLEEIQSMVPFSIQKGTLETVSCYVQAIRTRIRTIMHGSYLSTLEKYLSTVELSASHASARSRRTSQRYLDHSAPSLHFDGAKETNPYGLLRLSLSYLWRVAGTAQAHVVDLYSKIRVASQSNLILLSLPVRAARHYTRYILSKIKLSDLQRIADILLAIMHCVPMYLKDRMREDTSLVPQQICTILDFTVYASTDPVFSLKALGAEQILCVLHDLGFGISKRHISNIIEVEGYTHPLAVSINLLRPFVGPSIVDQSKTSRSYCSCSPVYYSTCAYLHWARAGVQGVYRPLHSNSLGSILNDLIAMHGDLNVICYPRGTVFHAIFDYAPPRGVAHQASVLGRQFKALASAGADPAILSDGKDVLHRARVLKSTCHRRRIFKGCLKKDTIVIDRLIQALEYYKQHHNWPDLSSIDEYMPYLVEGQSHQPKYGNPPLRPFRSLGSNFATSAPVGNARK